MRVLALILGVMVVMTVASPTKSVQRLKARDGACDGQCADDAYICSWFEVSDAAFYVDKQLVVGG